VALLELQIQIFFLEQPNFIHQTNLNFKEKENARIIPCGPWILIFRCKSFGSGPSIFGNDAALRPKGTSKNSHADQFVFCADPLEFLSSR